MPPLGLARNFGFGNYRQRHEKRDDPDRNVDVKDSGQRGVVDDVAAERRSDRRPDHRTHAENRHRGAALFGRIGFE